MAATPLFAERKNAHAGGMRSVLFLGNSHLSAFKLAGDDLPARSDLGLRFFCARGADLFFTQLSGGRLRPSLGGALSQAQLLAFYGPVGERPARYARPTADIETQLTTTGGTGEIEISDNVAIFYVAGLSPYDFVRLGPAALGMSCRERRVLLSSILGRDFFLARQIEDMRRHFPVCRHVLVGRPLGLLADIDDADFCVEQVVEARAQTQSMARDFLFDDVIMPPAELLSSSLLATKAEFFVGGRQESETFQKEEPTRVDGLHVNKHYGTVLMRDHLLPMIHRL